MGVGKKEETVEGAGGRKVGGCREGKQGRRVREGWRGGEESGGGREGGE